VPAKRFAFESELIAVGDDAINQINNRGPGCFIVLSKVLVVELNRSV
jgi:hypothetical protein